MLTSLHIPVTSLSHGYGAGPARCGSCHVPPAVLPCSWNIQWNIRPFLSPTHAPFHWRWTSTCYLTHWLTSHVARCAVVPVLSYFTLDYVFLLHWPPPLFYSWLLLALTLTHCLSYTDCSPLRWRHPENGVREMWKARPYLHLFHLYGLPPVHFLDFKSHTVSKECVFFFFFLRAQLPIYKATVLK